VARALPLTRTTDVERKFWPVAVRVKSPVSTVTVVGVIPLSSGAGGGVVIREGRGVREAARGHTWRRVRDLDVDGAHGRHVPARTLMSSWVPPTKVTGRAVPPTVAVAPDTSPVPVTRSVKPALPATTLVGVRLVRAGVGLMLATVIGLLAAAWVKPLLRKRRTS
jgi:hypothetical protein